MRPKNFWPALLLRVPDGFRAPWDSPEASEGPQGRFALLSLKPYNMGVYGFLYQARYIPFSHVRQYTQNNVHFIKAYGTVPIAYGCTEK